MAKYSNLPQEEIERLREEAEQAETRRTIKARQRKALRRPLNPLPNVQKHLTRKDTKPL